MKILNQILQPVKKFSKGMIALFTLNLVVVLCIFIFDSCKKSEYANNNNTKAAKDFITALKTNKRAIADVSFSTKKENNTMARSVAPTTEQPNEYQSVYISVPSDIDAETNNLIYTTNSIQQLTDLVQITDLDIQYEPITNNTSYQVNVPVEAVINSLQPMISESKQYLYAKGFTEQDIQQMLVEEQGIETDLIPFVMELTRLESEQAVASNNYLNYFITSTHARALTNNDFIRCGIVAIGADFIYGLSGSMASSWTVSAMKKAFGAVAKRMLGPIGVAITVVSFGICIGEAYYS
jgi:hypothetical protein